MVNLAFTPLLFFLFIIFACGQTSNKDEITKAGKPDQRAVPGKPAAGGYLKLKKHDVVDREGTGLLAVSCLIPEDWRANDRLYWDYNDATLPIRYQGQFKQVNGLMEIVAYPDVRSVYSHGAMGTSGFPPPRDAVSGLKDFIQQRRSGFKYQTLEAKSIHQSQPVDNYIQGTAFRTQSQTALVRIAYQENQIEMEEEFYGQLEITHTLSQGVVTLSSVIWSATGLYSCKAPKGSLDKCRQIAMTLRASVKMTLPFYNRYMQIVQLLSDQVYRNIYAAGQISRIVSQTNDQISKSISDSYWQTQKSYERTNQHFSDYVRGIDQYSDGQSQVQLPSGYSNAWVNDRGEYLMGETTSFDPNQMGIGNWRPLERK